MSPFIIRPVRLLLGLALSASIHPSLLVAQEANAPVLPEGRAVGVSVGRFYVGGESLTSLAVQVTELTHGRLGFDLALASSPSLLRVGVGALAADVGLAFNVSRPGVSLLPKFGASAVVGAGMGEADGVLGFHLGLGVLFQAGRDFGVRLDAVEHRYFEGLSLSVFSISLGLVNLPDRAR